MKQHHNKDFVLIRTLLLPNWSHLRNLALFVFIPIYQTPDWVYLQNKWVITVPQNWVWR